jgi:hypothetical protein
VGHKTSRELLERGCDTPQVGKVDRLLEALIREYGPDGRADIHPATIIRKWSSYSDKRDGGEP